MRNLSGLDAHRFTVVLDRQDVLSKSNLNLSDGRDGEVVLTAHPLGYLGVCFINVPDSYGCIFADMLM